MAPSLYQVQYNYFLTNAVRNSDQGFSSSKNGVENGLASHRAEAVILAGRVLKPASRYRWKSYRHRSRQPQKLHTK